MQRKIHRTAHIFRDRNAQMRLVAQAEQDIAHRLIARVQLNPGRCLSKRLRAQCGYDERKRNLQADAENANKARSSALRGHTGPFAAARSRARLAGWSVRPGVEPHDDGFRREVAGRAAPTREAADLRRTRHASQRFLIMRASDANTRIRYVGQGASRSSQRKGILGTSRHPDPAGSSARRARPQLLQRGPRATTTFRLVDTAGGRTDQTNPEEFLGQPHELAETARVQGSPNSSFSADVVRNFSRTLAHTNFYHVPAQSDAGSSFSPRARWLRPGAR